MSEALLSYRSPGRVNLIGDHTDYTGGLVLPMAIDRYTTIMGTRTPSSIRLRSQNEPEIVEIELPISSPEKVMPSWGRYVAGVAAEMQNHAHGFDGEISCTIPIGAGLSSSAALEVASALALGDTSTPVERAKLCQRAEVRGVGVPCGIMDQLTVASGIRDHALLIDCHDLTISPVQLPNDVNVIVQFIAERKLTSSCYAERVAQCNAAKEIVGPLRLANLSSLVNITDKTIFHRARHVVSENQRVRDFAAMLRAGDLKSAGKLMIESHNSLDQDFETSTPQMNAAVANAISQPGVFGARMTGGGFGGCIVILADAKANLDGWQVRAVTAASQIE
ncbi:MAG: galactokinase [Acidimicrobiaceae bacterium]